MSVPYPIAPDAPPNVAEVIAAIEAWQAAPSTCTAVDNEAAAELGRMLARAYVEEQVGRRS